MSFFMFPEVDRSMQGYGAHCSLACAGAVMQLDKTPPQRELKFRDVNCCILLTPDLTKPIFSFCTALAEASTSMFQEGGIALNFHSVFYRGGGITLKEK